MLFGLKELSHDIRTIFSTLRARRSYHAPVIENVTGTRRGRQMNGRIILLDGRDRDMRCPHNCVSAIRRRLSSYVRQGAGRPLTSSTGTNMGIIILRAG